ncbi:hypothetical protein BY458DRAFT_490546 [Sporodiniella umbellata]|nr:hypothetical protein BY458DRAFT_490546 [Sporodiniella umbellata]
MIIYFIINKLGAVVYQSCTVSNAAPTEGHRIRHLPLLVINDLIKANFHDTIQYIKLGNKSVAFKEFHFGPHWTLHLYETRRKTNITQKDISICLSQLPFLCGNLPLRSSDTLCTLEQIQAGEDLQEKLSESMMECCNSNFTWSLGRYGNHPSNTIDNKKMVSFFSPRGNHLFSNESSILSTWAHCFLFAREKIVSHCSNINLTKDELPDQFVYFLKLLVSHYSKERYSNDCSNALPKNISNNTTINSSVSSTSSQSFISYSSAASPSHHLSSSLAYVYNTSSSPFKIREKTSSSVTVVSSDSSAPYWCPPLTEKTTAPLSKLTTTTDTSEFRPPSNAISLNPSYPDNAPTIYDILNDNNQDCLLSGSVPSESNIFPAFEQKTNPNSAPSSPVLRSRSGSLSSNTNKSGALKHLLTNLMNGEPSYLDQTDDVKLVRRWIKLNDHAFLANIIIIHVYEGLCSVVVCKDDPEKLSKTANVSKPPWKPLSNQVKQFKLSLRSCLSDFHSFLLTKESTHFTNLSFTATYPGIVHFIYFEKGIMITPSIVDLNELDKNHELLYQVVYDNKTSNTLEKKKWMWPSTARLKQLGPKNQELLSIYFNSISADKLWNMHHRLLNDLSQRRL